MLYKRSVIASELTTSVYLFIAKYFDPYGVHPTRVESFMKLTPGLIRDRESEYGTSLECHFFLQLAKRGLESI